MKILSLKALNINSLTNETVIDFTDLTKNSALFAITGPTGSGKSTLLDIISCALYGRTARLKNPNDLMSRHKGKAYCEVEFEIKSKKYRASWTQKRARAKHDGKFQTAKMELVDLDTNTVFDLKSREVPKKVEELSGLDFGRFRQSMMLAQGGFDAFLKADEKERSALLEKITGTQIYADVSIAIFEKHRSMQEAIHSDLKILESIELLDDTLVAQMRDELDINVKEKQKSDAELLKLTRERNWVEKLSELILESEQYAKDLSEATKLKEESNASFQKLSLANSALNVSSTYTSHRQLQERIAIDNTTVIKLSEEMRNIQSEITTTTQEYLTLEEQLKDASRVFTLEKAKLTQARSTQTQESEVAKNIAKLTMLLEHKKKEQLLLREDNLIFVEQYKKLGKKEASLKKSSNDTSINDAMQKEELLRERLQNIQSELRVLSTHKVVIEKIENENKEIVKRGVEEQTLLEKQKVLKESIGYIKNYIVSLRDKKEQEQLLRKYEEDRKRLVAGEACILCGSKEHPYHNTLILESVDEVQTLIERESAALEQKESELGAVSLNITRVQTKLESAKLELLQLEEERVRLKVGSNTQEDLQKSEESTLQELRVLKEQRLLQEALLKERERLKEQLHQCELKKEQTQTKERSLTTEIQRDSDTLTEWEVSKNALAVKRVEILNVADLDAYEKEITTQYEKVQQRVQASKESLTTLKVKAEERTTFKKALERKIAENQKLFEQLTVKLEALYKENNFQNAEALQSALLGSEERRRLAEFCKSVEDTYIQAETLYSQTRVKLQKHQESSLSERDSESLEIMEALLKQKTDALQERIGSDKKALELNQENSDKYKERIASLEMKKEAFTVWVKLNELVGSSDGTKFKKFAQGITLDQLINLANQHLSILSRRYTLARNREKLLDLEVVDAFQGNVIRSVSTLSGGESFIVSLALALGLSELASQKIAIDSLFLDEGFGTLDEASLETALNALNLLQSSGKMVGLISHVEALKERIPLQIKIIPNGDGTSYVEVVK